jgi:hypothetical protein
VTVVRREAWRRWTAVAAAAAVVAAVPIVLRTLPVRAAAGPVAELYDRIRASARLPYQGYAVSTGRAGLPALPQLGDVASLFNGDTQLRVWYAAPDRWRVDVIDIGTERDVYQNPGTQYIWDYGSNQLTEFVGTTPVRLPRGADLVPPDLARRLLAAAGPRDGELSALPAQRVAGIAAAGLRLTPADPRTTVGRVDVWADPATGLPLQVAVTARGADQPILVSRFLDLRLVAPADPVLTPPATRDGIGFTLTQAPDIAAGLASTRPGPLPDRLAGMTRSTDDLAGNPAGNPPVGNPAGNPAAGNPVGLPGVGTYGGGLSQFVVLSVPRRIGSDAMRSAVKAGGATLSFPGADAVLITTPVLGVLVLLSRATRRTYLLAGLVGAAVLKQAGTELAGYRP